MEQEERSIVTIKDIAETVGVSRGTVDRVLNHRGRVSAETIRKVEAAAESLGYTKDLASAGLAARRKHIQLGFVYIDSDKAPFHQIIYEAARKKARSLAQYGVTVHFFAIQYFDEAMWTRFRAYVRQHPSIAGWALVGDVVPVLREIWRTSGMPEVPIVTYNIDARDPATRICHVGCDYEQNGRIACGLAALCSQGRGRVLVITEDPGNVTSSSERLQGFHAELQSYPDMQLAGTLYSSGTNAEGIAGLHEAVAQFLSGHPEVNVVYLMNPSDYSVCNVIHEAAKGREIALITNDLLGEEQRQMIMDGRITAVIDQQPERQGSKPLDILFQQITLDRAPQSAWIKTVLSIHIRQSLYSIV